MDECIYFIVFYWNWTCSAIFKLAYFADFINNIFVYFLKLVQLSRPSNLINLLLFTLFSWVILLLFLWFTKVITIIFLRALERQCFTSVLNLWQAVLVNYHLKQNVFAPFFRLSIQRHLSLYTFGKIYFRFLLVCRSFSPA